MGQITGMDLNMCLWVLFMCFIGTCRLRVESESDKPEKYAV